MELPFCQGHIWLLHLDTIATCSAASPEGQAVRADVPNYATGGVVVLDYELLAG